MGANRIGPVGHDDGIALAGIVVVRESRRNPLAPIDSEGIALDLQFLVGLLRRGFGVGIEQPSDGGEVRQVGVLVQIDPGPLLLLHAVVGDDKQVDRQLQLAKLRP